MSPKQRSLYFGTLWPAACERQGWRADDQDRRRDVTEEATGKVSTTALDEDEISALFRHLEWLANPIDFDAAMADQPDLAKAANRCRQLVWLMERVGLAEGYFETMLRGKCRAHHIHTWRELPEHDLRAALGTARKRMRAIRRKAAAARSEGSGAFANLCELANLAAVPLQQPDCPF